MLTAALASIVVCNALAQAHTTPRETNVDARVTRGDVTYELLDQQGKRHKATLVRIDGGDAVVLRTRQDGTVTVPIRQLQLATRHGDTPWDGALVGLGFGLALSYSVTNEDFSTGSSKQTLRDDLVGGAAFTILSTGVGFLIDLLHVGTHDVLVGTVPARRTSTAAIGLTGPSHDRRLQVGYRVTF